MGHQCGLRFSLSACRLAVAAASTTASIPKPETTSRLKLWTRSDWSSTVSWSVSAGRCVAAGARGRGNQTSGSPSRFRDAAALSLGCSPLPAAVAAVPVAPSPAHSQYICTVVWQVKIAKNVKHPNIIGCYDVLVSKTKVRGQSPSLRFDAVHGACICCPCPPNLHQQPAV